MKHVGATAAMAERRALPNLAIRLAHARMLASDLGAHVEGLPGDAGPGDAGAGLAGVCAQSVSLQTQLEPQRGSPRILVAARVFVALAAASGLV